MMIQSFTQTWWRGRITDMTQSSHARRFLTHTERGGFRSARCVGMRQALGAGQGTDSCEGRLIQRRHLGGAMSQQNSRKVSNNRIAAVPNKRVDHYGSSAADGV